jgi:hypothetical protein
MADITYIISQVDYKDLIGILGYKVRNTRENYLLAISRISSLMTVKFRSLTYIVYMAAGFDKCRICFKDIICCSISGFHTCIACAQLIRDYGIFRREYTIQRFLLCRELMIADVALLAKRILITLF